MRYFSTFNYVKKTGAPFTESLEEFYRHKLPEHLRHPHKQTGNFNVFRMEDCVGANGETVIPYARRAFYKISLVTGNNLYHYADRTLHMNGSALMFFNPQVPYTLEPLDSTNTGYFCILREALFLEKLKPRFPELTMFHIGGNPSYLLNEAQTALATDVFRKMMEEENSAYKFREDLQLNYAMELIHLALKMEPTVTLHRQTNANTRITTIFSELLERQFPIESTQQRFTLRSAKDFAEQLYVHVNHLNRAIRETTGKTTSSLIAERVTSEAKVLLKHTDWPISDIGYCLGFEEPAHFNNFFKKHTALSPSVFRMN